MHFSARYLLMLGAGLTALALPVCIAAGAPKEDESVNYYFKDADQEFSESKVTARTRSAKEIGISIHQAQQEEFGQLPYTTAAEFDKLRPQQRRAARKAASASGPLQKRVVGWHPYWMGTAYTRYDYSVLSTIAYFSYEVNPTNGSYVSLRSWDTTPLVAWAHSNNVKVVLTATCFGNSNNKLLLTNATACNNLINSLVSVVSNRGGDGVNLDFESISDSTLKPYVTAFMSNLAVRFHRDIPGSEVSLTLPAVDWSSVFDVGAYNSFMDYCIIMGYDYYYRGSATAGPVAPLKASSTWGAYCIEKSISNYLGKSLSADKLLLGCPYYGYDWPTVDYSVPSSTRGSGTATLYPSAIANAATYGRQWNSQGYVPYYIYTNSGARQCFYEDSESLGLKYDMVISKDIGGIGIWALGYDDVRTELWQLIADKFTTASVEDWQAQNAGTSSSLYGVGSSSNRYVAVGASGLVRTSTDGQTWVAGTSGVSALLLNVSGRSGTFVAVGDLGAVLTSANGQFWTSRSSATTNMLRGIAWGGGTYVAAGNNGAIVSSADGAAWTSRVSGTAQTLQGVTYASNLFVAAGAGGTILTSPDGATWTARSSGTSTWLLDTAYGLNTFVSVGLSGTILTSPDATNWTARTAGTAEHLYRVIYGGGKFVAVGTAGTILSSTNGAAWAAETSGTTNFLRGVTFTNGLFVACGYNGTLLTSGAGDPAVAISTLAATVPNGTASCTLYGTANAAVVGQIAWANNLGGSGSFAAATNWSFSASLTAGTNVIGVTGTNNAGRSSSASVSIVREGAGGGSASAASTAAAQPCGALDDIVIYTSAGHGFTASGSSWITGRGLLYGMNEDIGNVDQLTYFVEYCFRAGATVVPMRPVGNQLNEVVLDNDDAAEVSFGGSWNDSSSTIFYGDAGDTPYRYAYINATGTSAYAIYRPTIPAAGFYPVYAWTRSGSDRVRQLYRVYHSGGVTDVRVNHRRVGLGWVYLGTYHFDAGTAGSVNLSNWADGDPASNVVIADAIRFGNGMGNVNRGYGVSGLEREIEASRYWIQSMVGQGMSSTLYDLAGYSDSDDNVGAPVRMAAEMNRSEDGDFWDRIYLGFHSNADGGAGTARGAMGLYDTRGTATKQALQQEFGNAVDDEIETDMEWGDNGIAFMDDWLDNSADMYGSAYGELYGTMNDEMNSTIIETAFHNNAYDALLMRDPSGRRVMAQACYQAIVKHLHNNNAGVPLALLPDPPTNVCAVNTARGQIALSWRAPAVTSASGDAATGFIVYRSTNGYGFGNPVGVPGAASTSVTITNLTEGMSYYFVVAATNRGGESMPSKVVGARASPMGRAYHLVVNGFERNDRGLSPTTYYAYNLNGYVTRVRQRRINSQDYVVQHGNAIAAAGRYFDSCDNGAVLTGLISLPDYYGAYWILGEESTSNKAFSSSEQTLVMNFLNPGKRFFVSGAEMAFDLNTSGNSFLTNYLKVAYATDDAAAYQVTGKSGTIFNGLGAFSFDDGSGDTYNAEYPDTFYLRGSPVTSVTALVYGSAEGGTSIAGVQYSNVSRLVVFGFPFETILLSSVRNTIMANILTFFGDAPQETPVLNITNEDQSVAGGTATFAVGGTNNAAIAGNLAWTNRLTGGAGTFASAASWTVSVPVSAGTNTIVASGVNYLGTLSAADTVRVVVVSAASGAISVNLSPADVVSAGAQWRVDGGAWQNSGATVSNLSAGSHSVAFSDVWSWTNPPPRTLQTTNGQTSYATGVYTQIAAVGALLVTISPAEAVSAGAQWRVDGGAWQATGVTVSNLAVGSHSVTFTNVSGWTTPASQTVAVVEGLTTTSGGLYTRDVGSLSVFLEPQAAIDDGAQWNVDNGAWRNSAAIAGDLSLGIHTVRYASVSGFSAPAASPAIVSNGVQTVVSGVYTQITGGIAVTLAPAAAISAGALWRVDGGTWRASGDTESALSAGSHTVTFGEVAGWTAPAAIDVVVQSGGTYGTNGTYYIESSCPGYDNAQLVTNGAPYDNEAVTVSEVFEKTWTLKNTGQSGWTPQGGYELRFVEGDTFGSASPIALDPADSIAAGAQKIWSVTLTAPATPGVYRGMWMMYRGAYFGDPMWLQVNVEGPGSAE